MSRDVGKIPKGFVEMSARAIDEWRSLGDLCEIVADDLEADDEVDRPDIAHVFQRFTECFRELEGLSAELLVLYTEEHGAEG